MFDSLKLHRALESFPIKYLQDFNDFWILKNKVENQDTSILDDKHIDVTHTTLYKILKRWQTYHPEINSDPSKTLKISLKNMRNDYEQIRKYTLLNFKDIPEFTLRMIWHELGRVKEYEGETNEGGDYYAIAVTKPLLLLWGQTLAFDTRVRRNLPRRHRVSALDFKMGFSKWYGVMSSLSVELNESPEFIKEVQIISKEWFGESAATPYGRFLDIYYWMRSRTLM
jgi:hypothetical protein